MSFYRSLLAAVAAFVLVMPAFADETTTSTSTSTTTDATEQATPVAAQTTETQSTTTTTTETKTDLNKATVKELTKVKGITPAKAKAIVAFRKKNGDFKSTDDLKNVKGFKKMNADQMKQIQDQLTAG